MDCGFFLIFGKGLNVSRNDNIFGGDFLSAASYHNFTRGQAPVILTVQTDNLVAYQVDTSDVSKYATNPSVTPAAPFRNFTPATPIGDIVSVNGEVTKGLYASRVASILASPTPDPTQGGAIADSTHGSIRQHIFEVLKTDGTAIGTIIALGMNAGAAPGSPSGVTGDWALVGGTGAFLGVRGQMGNGGNPVAPRSASVVEDPGNRRANGGGKSAWVLTLFPMFRPQIVVTPEGPAVTHSKGFALVSASRPASPGELLSLFMTGLGPTQPGVDPGKPFPASPAQLVNSPVGVRVNGEQAEVLEAVGIPGAIDGYRVDFRIPPDTAKGVATVQVSAAWIPGIPVSFPVY